MQTQPGNVYLVKHQALVIQQTLPGATVLEEETIPHQPTLPE